MGLPRAFLGSETPWDALSFAVLARYGAPESAVGARPASGDAGCTLCGCALGIERHTCTSSGKAIIRYLVERSMPRIVSTVGGRVLVLGGWAAKHGGA